LYDLTARNPFIQVKEKRLHYTDENAGVTLKKLHQEAQFFRKEYDLDTSLFITTFLKWKEPGKQHFFITPLIFKKCLIKLNRKIEAEYEVILDEEENWKINPTLIHSFARFFDFELPEEVVNIEDFVQSLLENLKSSDNIIHPCEDLNDAEEWQIIQLKAIGNFNYKKSLLGKDFNEIIKSPSSAVLDLFQERLTPQLTTSTCTAILGLDYSQKDAVEQAGENNLVIQGPPGTGKSHTIVGMIGNFLAEGKKVLFISQKRSALQVVYDRLKELGLGHVTAFLNTEKSEKKDFFAELKSTWELLHEPINNRRDRPIRLDHDLLEFYNGNYQEKNEALGASFHDTICHLANTPYQKKELEFVGLVPKLNEWKNHRNLLQNLEELSKKHFKSETLSEAAFTLLNKAVFSEKDPIALLDRRMSEMLKILQEISSFQTSNNLPGSLKEFTQTCLAASILNMVNKTQLDLLNQESKLFKSFSSNAKKYHLLSSKVQRAEVANSKWVNKPTKAEITELIDLLKHRHAPKGILGILQRKSEKLENAFAGFDSKLTDIGKIQLLEELRSEWNLKGELEEFLIKLKHNYNIVDPQTEINHILQLRNKLNSISQNAFIQLLEREDSFEIITSLSGLHPKIQSLNNQARFIFHGESISNINEGIWMISKIKKQLHGIKLLENDLRRYFSLPLTIKDFIHNNPFKINRLDAIIAYHNLNEQSRFEPQFSQLSGENLQHDLDALSENEKLHFDQNIDDIKLRIHENIVGIEKLLATPSSRLKGAQRARKKRLKGFKRTLIHEISKKQRHMSLKQFSAETWELLSLMQSVWIMNPLSVSERFDCKMEMFDVVIFDEASQIPLEDALPSMQRARQVVVVGDEMQMPPSSFFSTSTDGFTLLDKASMSFQKIMLKWHYRSEHPALIEFSNRYFYENELLTIPPVEQENPIEFHKVNGVFKDGANIIEAKEIAKYLAKHTELLSKDVGIVAFSKEQENTIRKALSKNQIDQDALLISNLENVQGIEKDIIILSIGYAHDPEGKFRLNFGPVNKQSGANRLNVLFTRAKKKIILFSSVQAEDFGLTDNQGVACLRDYLGYAETLSKDKLAVEKVAQHSEINGSSFSCNVSHANATVLLIDPSTKESESKDLKTVYSVLKNRFKKVKILLTLDKLNQEDLFDSQFKEFFN
jgi:superfamily I DNA and/or RNA helicase